ncbi:MAG TPA: hypothetical protein VGG46_05640 [Terriglobales bacterium]|jgi:hypothetical protein
MRNILMASAVVVLFAGLSFAQAPGQVYGGTYWPGVYAGPFVPLISTPSASWNNHVPRAGATNATEGNVAGASSSGFSSRHAHFGQPEWREMRGEGMRAEEHHEFEHGERRGAGFDSGIASSEFSESVIVAMGQPHATQPSGTPRMISNQDVEQVNQKNGYVKYDDHVEHLDPAVAQ